jgi:cation:H+ antiporter
MGLAIALSIVGVIILIFAGDFLVRGASNLAYKMMISPMVVGLTIVAFGTSAPELFISTWAALSGSPNLAVGNVVGSNICNLSLVLGATAIFYPIIIKDRSVLVDWFMTIGSGVLLFFFMSLDGKIARFEGIIMLLILSIYTYALIQNSRKKTKEDRERELELDEDDEVPPLEEIVVWKEIAYFVAGIIGLYIGVTLFGENILLIAEDLGMSKELAGLTVVAFATSLPELITSVIAAYKRNTDMAIGNLLGSCIFNVLSILGMTSVIVDIDSIQQVILDRDMLWMFGVMLLIAPALFFFKKFNKFSGLLLVAFYVAYTTVLVIDWLNTGV